MDDANLSISEAVDSLATDLKTPSSESQPDGSDAKADVKAGEKPDGQSDKSGEVKTSDNGQDGNQDKDSANQDTQDKSVQDKGAEYTKERFDGLMSVMNKKEADYQKSLSDLNTKIEGLETQMKNPPKPENQDYELPPELQSADPETQAGFKLLMKASEGNLSKLEEKIVGKIMDTLNRPLKEQNEAMSKVTKEVEELSVELGKDFADNVSAIKKFAADNTYPLGTLRHAYRAWKAEKEIETLKGKKSDGQKTLEEIETEREKKGQIPTGSANRTGEVPKWDEKRDGGKGLSEILDEVKEFL